MRDLFRGYYQPSDDDFRKLWEQGLFVLDSNVILDLYRYPTDTRQPTLNVLNDISDRLWIPFHVALEYQDNRRKVVLEQFSRYSEVADRVTKARKNLAGQLGGMALVERHSSIDPSPFLNDLKILSENFIKEIDKLKDKHNEEYPSAKIRDEIDRLLGGRIGPKPSSQAEIDRICEEGIARYEAETPPGYGDSNKQDILRHEGLHYQRKFGDLIIWKQIIEYVKSTEYKQVALVTNDKKEDWWWIDSGKRIGARRSLTEEFYLNTGVELFWLYDTARLIGHSNKYGGTEVDEGSIRKVQDISSVSSSRTGVPYLDEKNVLNALEYFDAELRTQDRWNGFPDRHHPRHKYAVRHNDKLYPVKKVISLASGVPANKFSGGKIANKRIRDLGFAVEKIKRGSEDSSETEEEVNEGALLDLTDRDEHADHDHDQHDD